MRASAFNLYVEDYPDPGETLVHNTFSGAFAVLDAHTAAALKKSATPEPLTAPELALLDDEDLLDTDVAVVVRSRADEETEYEDWFERRRSRTRLEVIVHVNRACNFECSYCCQEEVMDGSVMSPETAAATADWLVSRAREIGADSMHLVFCGGEPLLHPGRIETVVNRVRESGIEMTFGMITNGYFLDRAMVDRFLPLGFVHAQVTLDGDETTHATTRISKRGENTFQRIFDHVIEASRSIRIAINGNYQDDTVHGFAPLIRKLSDAGLPVGSKVSFSPALSGLSAKEGAGSGSCTWSGANTGAQVALRDQAALRGFDSGGPAHSVGPCSFFDRHSYAIDVDGTIFKCPGFVGHREWAIGDVEAQLNDRYERMLVAEPRHACGDCSFRPTCSGGCVASAWMRAGEIAGVNCEGEYFEQVAVESVTREYVIATADSRQEAVERFARETEELLMSRGTVRGRRPESLRVIAA